MSIETLLVLFEGLLVFGGAVAFGIWQLRSVARDQEKTRAAKNRESS